MIPTRPVLSRLALIAALAASPAALAHSDTGGTTPADGAVVSEVEVIELGFDKPMRITQMILSGPDGPVELDRDTGLDPVMSLRAVPVTALQAGDYSVEWRGLSSDGHPMQGTVRFTVSD